MVLELAPTTDTVQAKVRIFRQFGEAILFNIHLKQTNNTEMINNIFRNIVLDTRTPDKKSQKI